MDKVNMVGFLHFPNPPPSQESMSLYMDLNFDHDEYKIYVFTKSWFYDSLSAGRLEILTIKKGYHAKVLLSLQVNAK